MTKSFDTATITDLNRLDARMLADIGLSGTGEGVDPSQIRRMAPTSVHARIAALLAALWSGMTTGAGARIVQIT